MIKDIFVAGNMNTKFGRQTTNMLPTQLTENELGHFDYIKDSCDVSYCNLSKNRECNKDNGPLTMTK